jgi:putative membrane protein
VDQVADVVDTGDQEPAPAPAGAAAESDAQTEAEAEAELDAQTEVEAEGVVERDPDVRFSYANERTFLAWNRTALALVTAGLAVTQLLPPFDVPGGRRLIGLPLIVLGTALALLSLRQWRLNERAMRRREPLPPSPLPKLVALVIGACAVVAGVLAALGGKG